MSEQTERQSLLLPILMPVGLLAVIGLVLFGFSRVLLAISHAAATVVALVALVVIMAVASFVASRRQVSGASVFWMVAAIVGVVIAVGGLTVVASPLAEEVEPQTVPLGGWTDGERRRLHGGCARRGQRYADRAGLRQPGRGRPAQRRDLRRRRRERAAALQRGA